MTGATPASQALTPPRAAAVAGVAFAVLMIVGLGTIQLASEAGRAIPGLLQSDQTWRTAVRIALNLISFSGVAFLWFLGVLRNRLGELEDRFFATVFLGSGLLFVASLFVAAAIAGTIVDSSRQLDSTTAGFYGQLGRAIMNFVAMKMAGVFMFSTCTISLRTRILPRWLAFTGFACGVVLLLVLTTWPWIDLLFPLWVLVVSLRILAANLLAWD
jgi:hypothetical protein